MQTPLQITFRHLDLSPALEARIREHVERLERFHDRITGCHVVVEAPAGHSSKGAPFDVKIDVRVPGAEIAVRSRGAEREGHTDVYVTLRDAFDSLRRLLQDHARARRADIRHPARKEL
jgi:ribosomal subunit interface protein